jgi:protein-disulfide isomerase
VAKKQIAKNASGKNVSDGTKNAQAIAARLREQQAAKDKRTKLIFGGIIGVFVVVLIAVVIWIFWQTSDAAMRAKLKDVHEVPSLFNDDGSFTVSKNGGGKDKIIKNAISLDVYNDFMCPGCGGFERAYGATLEELVATGKVNVTFHPLAWFDSTSPLDKNGKNDQYSTRAASAAIYIAQNVPDKYMAFVKSMYSAANQPCEGYKGENKQYCSRPEGGYDPEVGSDEKIKEHIIEAGISPDIAQKALDGKYRDYIKAVSLYVQQVHHKGTYFRGTPAIFLNDAQLELSEVRSPEAFKEKVLSAGK